MRWASVLLIALSANCLVAEAQLNWDRDLLQKESIADIAHKSIVFLGLPYQEIQTAADVYIHYSATNSEKKILSPLLVVEGFFPNSLPKIGITNPIRSEVLNTIRLSFPEMDLIYVAWRNAEAPIEANSETLKIILLWLQEEMAASGTQERITLIGHSMGGLVARWTLTQMESKQISHGVERYISYDTPHLGAHFPLGLAYGVQGAAELALAKKQFVKYLPSPELFILNQMGDVLHAPSVEQMVLTNVMRDGGIDNSKHFAWLEKLKSVGLPKGDLGYGIECLGISNSDNKVHPALNAPYIDVNFEGKSDLIGLFGGMWDFSTAISTGVLLNDVKAALLSILPGRTRIKGAVYCAPGAEKSEEITKLEVKLEKRLFFFIPIHYTVYSYKKSYPKGIESYDYLPSSFWPLGGFKSKEKNRIPIFRDFRYNIASTMAMPFIPAYSALAMESTNESLFGEKVFIADEPLNHNVFSGDALKWIREEMDLE